MSKISAPDVIRGRNKGKYDELKEGPLEELSYGSIFVYAAAMGYRRGTRIKNEGDASYITRTEYLGDKDSRQWWIINSIAIADEDDITIIKNRGDALEIAIEYANSGITILYDMIFDSETSSVEKIIENDLRQLH